MYKNNFKPIDPMKKVENCRIFFVPARVSKACINKEVPIMYNNITGNIGK